MNAAAVVSCSYSITNWTFVAKVFCFWTIHCEERTNLMLEDGWVWILLLSFQCSYISIHWYGILATS